jgi:hypothetical protein
MNVTMVLCDHADVAGGKLYINGAGWNMLIAEMAVPMALGIIVSVPWDQTDVRHSISVELTDEDGQRVSIHGEEILQSGHFETGRPAGVPHGTPIDLPLSMRFVALPLPAGGYSFLVTINDVEEARVSFRAVERA